MFTTSAMLETDTNSEDNDCAVLGTEKDSQDSEFEMLEGVVLESSVTKVIGKIFGEF